MKRNPPEHPFGVPLCGPVAATLTKYRADSRGSNPRRLLRRWTADVDCEGSIRVSRAK